MDETLFSKNKSTLLAGFIGVIILAVVAFASIAIYTAQRNIGDVARPRARQVITHLPTRPFGNWSLGCVAADKSGKRCFLVLIAAEAVSRQPILRLSVVMGDKGPEIIVLAPPNALTTTPFSLTPDKGQTISAPFDRCFRAACQAKFLVTDAAAAALKQAAGAQASFAIQGGQKVTFHVPISGFADGYAAWAQASKASTAPH